MKAATISSTSFNSLCNRYSHTHHRSHSSGIIRLSEIPSGQHGLLFLNINQKKHIKPIKMEIQVSNEIHQLAAGPIFPEWSKWMLGALLPLLLPFFKNKWGPLQILKVEVETAMETAETLTEMVEEVAEKVEEVAEEIAEKLPEDVKLKETIKQIESLAKEAVKDAKAVQQVIHQVEEAEKKVEDALTSPKDQKPEKKVEEAKPEKKIEEALMSPKDQKPV